MSEVCKVETSVWQRKDERWSAVAKLSGPGPRRTKISHRGCLTREDALERVNGDVNELVNGMGWERLDEPTEEQL